ncbi:I78 family peptidase inhibitor [Novosphingobium guangzhouense]|uniref:Peptidase inhibitor I78 n=1 Tax=Novosphingobium guangzhouense TaxID=1850347 RepID=A0A2K2G1Z3_9SPHN|nr:I78 family peptidase inhibitor [Novosphingobium guangzhouense]PNU05070.1 hypothetical protein A8V01_04355 [Novosphingobium guangzhouense]
MSPNTFIAPLALALMLAACNGQASPEKAPAPVAENAPTCGADQFASYIGQQATDATIAAIQSKRGDAPIRVIRPGMAVTMDYRAERLNVDVDGSGTIKRFHCS